MDRVDGPGSRRPGGIGSRMTDDTRADDTARRPSWPARSPPASRDACSSPIPSTDVGRPVSSGPGARRVRGPLPGLRDRPADRADGVVDASGRGRLRGRRAGGAQSGRRARHPGPTWCCSTGSPPRCRDMRRPGRGAAAVALADTYRDLAGQLARGRHRRAGGLRDAGRRDRRLQGGRPPPLVRHGRRRHPFWDVHATMDADHGDWSSRRSPCSVPTPTRWARVPARPPMPGGRCSTSARPRRPSPSEPRRMVLVR